MKDVIIIGCGPAGLSAAVAAGKQNLSYAVYDKANIVNTITNFPTDMTFNSTPELLEIDGLPFNSAQVRPSRREAVRYYQRVASHYKVQINAFHEFTGFEKTGRGFVVHLRHAVNGKKIQDETEHLIIATGYYDFPKKLNVPGEDLPHVSHYYKEPYDYHGRDVVIIGAGNSAVEAALDIFRNGGRVTIIHRGEKIKKGVKYWVLPDILNRIRQKSIKLIANAQVKKISPDSVEYERKNKRGSVKADNVLALIGYQPDRQLLAETGAAFDTETLEPEVNPETYESSIKGLYFAGSMLTGIFPNRIFIENSRAHGEIVISDISSKKR